MGEEGKEGTGKKQVTSVKKLSSLTMLIQFKAAIELQK